MRDKDHVLFLEASLCEKEHIMLPNVAIYDSMTMRHRDCINPLLKHYLLTGLKSNIPVSPEMTIELKLIKNKIVYKKLKFNNFTVSKTSKSTISTAYSARISDCQKRTKMITKLKITKCIQTPEEAAVPRQLPWLKQKPAVPLLIHQQLML